MDHRFDQLATHNEKHWVSDGNVVLSAISSQKSSTILFRVHKSLLSDQSEVFASMFELPQGDGDVQVELYEGLPLVRLQDTSEEVCALLDALRNPLPLAEKNGLSDTPIRIRGALHMSSKYLMTNLRASLIRIFENEWPTTLEELEYKDHLFQDCLGQRKSHGSGWPAQFVPEPAAAIALAEDYDVRTVLPAAYYDLLRCAPRSDWKWLERPGSYMTKQSDKPARWGCLSRKSLRKFHRLQDFLTEETCNIFEYYDMWLLAELRCPRSDSRSELCQCGKTWLQLIPSERDIPLRPQDRDLFNELRRLRFRTEKSEICYNCKRVFLKAIDDIKRDTWERIRKVCLEEEDTEFH